MFAIEVEPGEGLAIAIYSSGSELAPARAAGLQVLLSIRPGNARQPDAAGFEAIRSLDEIS